MRPRHLAVIVAIGLAWPAGAPADVVELEASRDNTLYDSPTGVLSNGAGDHFFVGMPQSLDFRRSVIAFDVGAAIPVGSTVNSVTLTLFMSRTSTGANGVSLHRALADWGEGNSDAPGEEGAGTASAAGDATWIHTFYQTSFWSNAGGDYSGIPSATTTVGGVGSYAWSSASLAGDVQGWVDNPASDFGWVILGTETGNNPTSKRFDSRTNPSPSRRPRLTVDFTPAVVDGACCTGGSTCSIGTEQDCETAGGTFHGAGSDCSPNVCTQPAGACCSSDGSCVEVPGSSCGFLGGTYLGTGTSCTPGICPLPTGACCADAGTCSVETEPDSLTADGSYQGDGVTCHTADCPVVLAPFVEALPIPPVAQPVTGSVGGEASYEIAAREFQAQLHPDLPPTTLWGYEGMSPGPTIEAAAHETVTVTWVNDLRDDTGSLRTEHYLPVDLCPHGPSFEGPTARSVVHLHGAHVAAEFDGYPEDTILPGEQQVYVYPNHQLPATLWYHDHALGITRLNLYLGMAAFYLIRDPFEQSLGLPSGEYEIPLMIQDRKFNPDGTLSYPAAWQEHFFGDTILVNGRVWPYLDVKQGKYRFRVVNASGSRTYTLGLSDPGMQLEMIGTEGGLLPSPVLLDSLTLSPAERADLVIDFEGLAPGTEVVLTNSAPAPFPNVSNEGVIPNVMKFVVSSETGHTAAIPGALRPLEVLQESDAVLSRDFEMFVIPDTCSGTAWTINGLRWDDIVEYPLLGTTEIWRWINRSGMMHPMHMHLVMFQVLDRQPFELVAGVPTPIGVPVPPGPEEAGWKDTVQANPGEITRVIARFETYKGKFAYHCHIVEHEDNEMMRQFQSIECGDGELDPTEECEDGNPYWGDGCSDTCKIEEFLDLTGVGQGGTVHLVVDGVSIFALVSSGETADDILQELADAINNNITLIPRGITARVQGSTLVVNAEISLELISDPGLVERLTLKLGTAGLWWSRIQASDLADVVRGDLNGLIAGGGNFTVATDACAADNAADTFLAYAATPAAGSGYWYLVRAATGGGTYDTGEPTQAGPRDGGIGFSGNDCP